MATKIHFSATIHQATNQKFLVASVDLLKIFFSHQQFGNQNLFSITNNSYFQALNTEFSITFGRNV
jgi:hypothetical protein